MASERAGSRPARLRRWLGMPAFVPLGAFAAAAAAGALVGSAAFAEEAEVPLEQLLRLPDSYDTSPSVRRAGADATQWRARFTEARERITNAEAALAKAKLQLKGLAGDSAQWQAAAPGVGGDPGESPLSFKLRDQLRESREELDAAERALRDLEVEANLGGVPESWRYPEGRSPERQIRRDE